MIRELIDTNFLLLCHKAITKNPSKSNTRLIGLLILCHYFKMGVKFNSLSLQIMSML